MHKYGIYYFRIEEIIQGRIYREDEEEPELGF